MSELNEQILAQLKKNESYLQQIAVDQAASLEINKKHLSTERYKVVILGLKFMFIVILTFVSIVFLQSMTEDLMGNLTGLGGNGQSLEISGADDLSQQLRSSQDLMREIMGR